MSPGVIHLCKGFSGVFLLLFFFIFYFFQKGGAYIFTGAYNWDGKSALKQHTFCNVEVKETLVM